MYIDLQKKMDSSNAVLPAVFVQDLGHHRHREHDIHVSNLYTWYITGSYIFKFMYIDAYMHAYRVHNGRGAQWHGVYVFVHVCLCI